MGSALLAAGPGVEFAEPATVGLAAPLVALCAVISRAAAGTLIAVIAPGRGARLGTGGAVGAARPGAARPPGPVGSGPVGSGPGGIGRARAAHRVVIVVPGT